jgi:hypothetical protein
MGRFNKVKLIIRYILICVTSIAILYVLYSNGIKTLAMIVVIISLIGVVGTNNQKNDNKCSVFIVILGIVICILSTIFDNTLEKEKPTAQASTKLVDTGNNNVIQNGYQTKDTPKEITTAVSFRSPSEIEKELENQIPYYPRLSNYENETLLFLRQTIITDICDASDYYVKSIGILEERINEISKSEKGYDISKLNSNKEVTKLLEEANKLEVIIKKGGTLYEYSKQIEFYSKAFELAPCGLISLQLARPYEEIILKYPRSNENDFNNIFSYGIYGIKYFIQTMSYDEVATSMGDLLYRIAKIYHFLGDIPNLDIELRKELYITSCSYFELSFKFEGEDNRYKNYNDYYCAMVNHKLGVISGQDNYFYLINALKYYDKVKDIDGISNQTKKDASLYASEVCERLCIYIEKYGQVELLSSKEYYIDLSIKYNDDANYYQKVLSE